MPNDKYVTFLFLVALVGTCMKMVNCLQIQVPIMVIMAVADLGIFLMFC